MIFVLKKQSNCHYVGQPRNRQNFHQVLKVVVVNKWQKCKFANKHNNKMLLSILHLRPGGSESYNTGVCSDNLVKHA